MTSEAQSGMTRPRTASRPIVHGGASRYIAQRWIRGEVSIAVALKSFDAAVAQLLRAPFEHDCWKPALAATANATGSASAGLIGTLTPGEPTVAVSPSMSDSAANDVMRDWVACGGSDPRRNPLLAHTLRSPVLREVSDADVISRDARKRHPLWNEFYDRSGLPHYCVSPLWRRGAAQLAVSLPRTAKQGPIAEGERRRFRRLAAYWREAAMLSHALKDEGARLLAGALNGLSIAAVIVDGFGRVVSTTEAAEEIVRSGILLRLNQGWLAAALPAESAKLEAALHASIGGPAQARCAACDIELRGSGGQMLCLRLSPLPRDNDIGFGAAAMVVVEPREPRRDTRPLDWQRFGLTDAEAKIANSLFDGQPVESIARRRHVSLGTVRSQIKSVYSKAGVHSRIELMALRRARRIESAP